MTNPAERIPFSFSGDVFGCCWSHCFDVGCVKANKYIQMYFTSTALEHIYVIFSILNKNQEGYNNKSSIF